MMQPTNSLPAVRIALIFGLLMCCWATPAASEPIFSNLGVDGAFIKDTAYNVQSVCIGTCFDVDMAMSFTPLADSLFDSVSLPIGIYSPQSSANANVLDIWLMADESGMPGQSIESIHLVGSMFDAASQDPESLVASSVMHPLLCGASSRRWRAGSLARPLRPGRPQHRRSDTIHPSTNRMRTKAVTQQTLLQGAGMRWSKPASCSIVPRR
jgi:hypothetical protein